MAAYGTHDTKRSIAASTGCYPTQTFSTLEKDQMANIGEPIKQFEVNPELLPVPLPLPLPPAAQPVPA